MTDASFPTGAPTSGKADPETHVLRGKAKLRARLAGKEKT